MNLEEFIYDVKYDKCYLLRKEIKCFFKTVFMMFFEWIKELLFEAFILFRVIVARILGIIKKITTLGFLIGFILLVMNIYECINQNKCISLTSYYKPMIYLIITHIAVYFLWKISRLGIEDIY